MMSETAHVFGPLENLVGVYAEAVGPASGRSPTGVLMLTPGMLHHVGPFRLHVDLARKLAEQGLPSLRFCLSGIGESLGVGSEATSLERAREETGQAMDLLSQMYGLEKFILFGLCSGADDSVHVALSDDRVIGLALLDGCGFRTPRFYFEKVKHAVPRKARTWLNVGKDERRSGRVTPLGASTLPAGDDVREFPDRQAAERQLLELSDRGVEMLFLYTGGVGQYYNYRDQFADMFPRLQERPGVQWRYFNQLDHVLRLSEDRRMVVDQLAHWMTMVYLRDQQVQLACTESVNQR